MMFACLHVKVIDFCRRLTSSPLLLLTSEVFPGFLPATGASEIVPGVEFGVGTARANTFDLQPVLIASIVEVGDVAEDFLLRADGTVIAVRDDFVVEIIDGTARRVHRSW